MTRIDHSPFGRRQTFAICRHQFQNSFYLGVNMIINVLEHFLDDLIVKRILINLSQVLTKC